MLRFKKYLREMWNPDDQEDIDMSHAYTSYSNLSEFPTTHASAVHAMDMNDLRKQQYAEPHRAEEIEREINQRNEAFRTRAEESKTDPSKKVKYNRHTYTYPTLADRERIKQKAVNGMIPETKHEFEGQKMLDVNHVLDNLHMFPGHHSGEVIFRETLGEPTEVMITEHNRWNKPEDRITSIKDAMNAYKYVLSAVRHFTSLPVGKWRENGMTSPYDRKNNTHTVEPHRITDVPSGVHIFSGSTSDHRKHNFYDMVTKKLGHIFFNTVGKPVLSSRERRIYRRTGTY